MVKSPFATCIPPERVSLFLFFPFFSFNTKKTSYKTRRTVLILNNTSLVSILLFPQITAARFCILERFLPCGLPACLPACTAHQKALSLQIPQLILFVVIQTFDEFFSTSFWGVLMVIRYLLVKVFGRLVVSSKKCMVTTNFKSLEALLVAFVHT